MALYSLPLKSLFISTQSRSRRLIIIYIDSAINIQGVPLIIMTLAKYLKSEVRSNNFSKCGQTKKIDQHFDKLQPSVKTECNYIKVTKTPTVRVLLNGKTHRLRESIYLSSRNKLTQT